MLGGVGSALSERERLEFLEGIHSAGDVDDVLEAERGEVFAGFCGTHSGFAVDDDFLVFGKIWDVFGKSS